MGNNPLPITLFTYYSLNIKFVPFLKSKPATIPRKRKTIKWATKPPIKKEKKEKKRAREKARKSPNLGFCTCVNGKTKKLFNYIRLVGKYALFLAKLVFIHSYAIAEN